LIKFAKYKDLIELLFHKKYYFTYKNPAKNIELDYVVGKEKTKVTITFEFQTRRLKITESKIKHIVNQIREEGQNEDPQI